MPPVRQTANRPRPSLDGVGAVTACACACHCIATPLMLAAFPLLRGHAGLGDPLEWGFVAVSLLVGAHTFGTGLRVAPRRVGPLLAFAAGFLLVLGARLLAPEGDRLVEPLGVVAGTACIAGAHLWNHRRRAACCSCVEADHSCEGA